MPDGYGFDHLGTDVRCIDCPTGGPIWTWPEERRHQHALDHRTPSLNTTELRRQRELLAAPPTDTHEESKENHTMATTKKPTKNESTKTVTIDLLRRAGAPLPAKEIAKRVIDSGRCTNLKGKTPEATITAMLAIGSKPGGASKRVGKGTYELADPALNATEQPTPQTPAAKTQTAKTQPSTRQAKPRTRKART